MADNLDDNKHTFNVDENLQRRLELHVAAKPERNKSTEIRKALRRYLDSLEELKDQT